MTEASNFYGFYPSVNGIIRVYHTRAIRKKAKFSRSSFIPLLAFCSTKTTPTGIQRWL